MTFTFFTIGGTFGSDLLILMYHFHGADIGARAFVWVLGGDFVDSSVVSVYVAHAVDLIENVSLFDHLKPWGVRRMGCTSVISHF